MLADLERVAQRAATASVNRGSDLAVLQFVETAADVVAGGRSFAATQRAAAAATSDTAEALSGVSAGAEWIVMSHEQWPELDDLRVVWKAWFLFVRALCDNVYRLLLADVESCPAPLGGSMGTAASNKANSVALILAEDVPEFLPWFTTFRDRRNAVKRGVNFTCTALQAPGISITFNEFRSDPTTGRRQILIDSDKRRVTLSDVVGDVRQLVDIVTVVANRYGESGRSGLTLMR